MPFVRRRGETEYHESGSRVVNTVENATRSDGDRIPLMLPAQASPNRMSPRSEASYVSDDASNTSDVTIWPAEEWVEREAAKYPIPPSRVRELVDMQALNYVDPTGIDDNLLCPICKVPFVTPVTTPCDHTFCFDCLRKGYEINDTCAVDREPFRPDQVKPASRIIRNQLDALLVECPSREYGCSEKLKREDLVMHVHRCDYTLTRCPDKDCDKQVVKWLAARDECLHYEQTCIYCDELIEMAWMQEHVDNSCPKNQATCAACNEPVRKSDIESHRESRCPEADAPCDFTEYGCRYTSKRKQLPDHQQGCPFQVCAALGKTVKAQQVQIERFKRESDERDRLIWELQQERHKSNVSWDDFRLHPQGPKFRSAEEAMMGIYEEVERRIDGARKGITDLEGRQTVMVLNELIPIKNEISEIRANLGVVKIHVSWLMNKSREEVERNRLASQAVNAANTGAGASQTSAGRRRQGSDTDVGPVPRRLSDGSNGIPRL